MRCHLLKRLLVVSVAIAALSSCLRSKPTSQETSATKDVATTRGSSAEDDLSAQIQRSEAQSADREAARVCGRPVEVYDGSVTVNASDYLHPVARGDDYVDQPIDGLDKVLSKSTRVRFTLDYPFERPYDGAVMGEITLRRTIDAVRAGFRQMYKGTTQSDIPGLQNKDVAGPYGRAFHVIDDLVIERIDLCADDTFLIAIGS